MSKMFLWSKMQPKVFAMEFLLIIEFLGSKLAFTSDPEAFDHDFDAHLTAEVVFCEGDEGVEGLTVFERFF